MNFFSTPPPTRFDRWVVRNARGCRISCGVLLAVACALAGWAFSNGNQTTGFILVTPAIMLASQFLTIWRVQGSVATYDGL